MSAATLKLIGLNFAPFAQYGVFLTPSVQSAAVVWEVILGIWLFTSFARFLAWILTLTTFVGFAIVSGYLGVIGQAHCGCFGVIEASPWAAFAVDVAVLILLAAVKPQWSSWAALRTPLLWLGSLASSFLLAGLVCNLAFGSIEAALAWLRGEPLGNSPAVVDFGSGTSGETVTRSVTVHNYQSIPLKLVGGTSDCSCLATQDLPITIAPHSRAEVSISITLNNKITGNVTRVVYMYTDSIFDNVILVYCTINNKPIRTLREISR